MPKTAFSYARFSSIEQERGDSERRQVEAARKYAKDNGYNLNESIGVDRGKSAFTGKNISEGALGEFIKRIEAREITKGAALFVESPDRVSRQPFSECWPTYQRILSGGIELHFLSTRDVLKPNHSFTDILRVGVNIDRANSESAHKSLRGGEAWSKKRNNANGKSAMSAKVPKWLRAEKGYPITVIPERAAIVRKMYEWAAKGLGQYTIADKLIAANVPPWGPVFKGRPPRWFPAYVGDILRSRTVIGEYQPHTKRDRDGNRVPRHADGDPIPNYYPAVVPLQLWQKVQEVRKSLAQSKFGEALHAGKDKFSDKNLFRKLVFDASNDAPMTYRSYDNHPCLVTTWREDVRQHKVPYPSFENSMLEFLSEADWKEISRESESPKTKELSVRQEVLAKAIDDNSRILGRYESLLDDPDSKGFQRIRDKYKLAIAEAERLIEERNALEAEIAASIDGAEILSSTSGSEFTRRDRTSKEARLKLRLLIAQRVRRIDVHFDKTAKSFMGADALAKIRFANGVERWIAFGAGIAVGVYINE